MPAVSLISLFLDCPKSGTLKHREIVYTEIISDEHEDGDTHATDWPQINVKTDAHGYLHGMRVMGYVAE